MTKRQIGMSQKHYTAPVSPVLRQFRHCLLENLKLVKPFAAPEDVAPDMDRSLTYVRSLGSESIPP
jgi:hypothetical protein